MARRKRPSKDFFNRLPPIDPVEPPERALRHNAGKPELFYADMFPDALAAVCATLTYGTSRKIKPYPRYNWCKGAPYTELYSCARRHMLKALNGEELDADAKSNDFEVHHLAFAAGNILRLLQQVLDGRTDLDDRGFRQGKEPQR